MSRCTDMHNIRDDVVMWRPDDIDEQKPDAAVLEMFRVLDRLLRHELGISAEQVHRQVYRDAPLWVASHWLRDHRGARRLAYPKTPREAADLLRILEREGYAEMVMSIRDRLLTRSWQLAAMTG